MVADHAGELASRRKKPARASGIVWRGSREGLVGWWRRDIASVKGAAADGLLAQQRIAALSRHKLKNGKTISFPGGS
jgi:hypothetical protein